MRSLPTDVQLPKVEIHVTEVCNNRCGFCTSGWLNAEDAALPHVPREVIRQKLEDAYGRGARRVLFQGGEPTVRRDLGDLLADAHAVGYGVTTVFTNARMAASRAGARWLAGMGVTWFQVSLQGGTAAAHDASVGARGAFDQTVAGTRRLLAMGQRVKVNGVLTRHLLDTLGPFADLIADLAPEEVGLDTVKPSGAFTPDRASYADLCPRYTDYAAALRDAVLAMNDAGVLARLTSFPPCLVPGAEHLVSEEAPTTETMQSTGVSVSKLLWKRGLQVKAEGCRSCAYDLACGGLYAPYAEVHGLGELRPLAARAAPAPATARRRATALTRALHALFVRGGGERVGARDVRLLPDGSHEVDCYGPGGDVCVTIRARGEGPAYALTEAFAVSYQRPPAGAADLRVVDALVRALRRVEPRLRALAGDDEA